MFLFIESDCQASRFDLSDSMVLEQFILFLPSISGTLKNGLKNGKNALITSLQGKTAVTLTHRIPPSGCPTASSSLAMVVLWIKSASLSRK